MARVEKVKYYTDEKYSLISNENLQLYENYLNHHMVVNRDTFESTYVAYQNSFNQFMVFVAEECDNIGLYSEEFMKDGVNIVLRYMNFCMKVLKNNKKTVNNKVSAIMSFYNWSDKHRKIPSNPLNNKIERLARANEQQIINDIFLTEEQMDAISAHLIDSGDDKYDFQDTLLWFIFLDSANRVGAIEQLSISKFDAENNCFRNVIEKEARSVDVAMSEQTKQLVLWWIEQRKVSYDLLTEDALFITKFNGRWNRMTKRTVQRRVQKIGQIVGIEDLHPHSIRKSAASQMLDHGVDSYLISRYLNHKSMEVLKNYIKTKSSSDLRKQIEEQLNKNT